MSYLTTTWTRNPRFWLGAGLGLIVLLLLVYFWPGSFLKAQLGYFELQNEANRRLALLCNAVASRCSSGGSGGGSLPLCNTYRNTCNVHHDTAVEPDLSNQPELPRVPGGTLGGETPGSGSCNLSTAEAIRRQIAFIECYQGCRDGHLSCREAAAAEPNPVLRDLRDKACFAETAECGQGCRDAASSC